MRLARAGHTVLAIVRRNEPIVLRELPRVELLRADLRALRSLAPPLDALVHCAADLPARCPDPEELRHSNVEGTRAVVTAAIAAGAQRIVYLSSMSVYGEITVPVVTEDTPINRPDAYGQSKLEGERQLNTLCAEHAAVGALSIRLPGVVGIGSRHNFLSGTLERILRGESVRANHPESLFNNIVHVSDLTGFIADRVSTATRGYAVTNIAAREPIPMRRVLGLLFDAAGKRDRTEWNKGGKTPFTIAIDRVQALGYRPPTTEESLLRFASDVMAESAVD